MTLLNAVMLSSSVLERSLSVTTHIDVAGVLDSAFARDWLAGRVAFWVQGGPTAQQFGSVP